MAKRKKRLRVIIIILLFIIYFILAARPVPRELILAPGWISPLDSDAPVSVNLDGFSRGQYSNVQLPFTLGDRFGYIDSYGRFAINRVKISDIYLSNNMWTEYEAEPSVIEIKNIAENTIITIENVTGYPILLDNRVFIIGSEMNALSEIDNGGNVLWTYEFGAPLTCIDAAAGLVMTGSIDGVIEILDSAGERIFYFVPGGSRLEVITGCAISGNGSRLGIVSGLDQQRFLLLERFGASGGEYRVVYHEFTGNGFRRPVRVLFIDEDRRIVYERAGGIGCYNIRSRRAFYLSLDGDIAAVDNSGDQDLFFLIITHNELQSDSGEFLNSSEVKNELIGIKFPPDRRFLLTGSYDARDAVFLRAPFKSSDVYLGRTGSLLIAGGGGALVSFAMEEK